MTVLLSCLTHIVLIGEEFVVEGQTDSVGTLRGNEVDISTGDIVIFELLPELCGEIRAYSLFEEQVNHPGRVGASETEHVAFRIQPVTEVRALYQQLLSIGLNQVVAIDGNEASCDFLFATCCAGSEHEEKRQERKVERDDSHR